MMMVDDDDGDEDGEDVDGDDNADASMMQILSLKYCVPCKTTKTFLLTLKLSLLSQITLKANISVSNMSLGHVSRFLLQ